MVGGALTVLPLACVVIEVIIIVKVVIRNRGSHGELTKFHVPRNTHLPGFTDSPARADDITRVMFLRMNALQRKIIMKDVCGITTLTATLIATTLLLGSSQIVAAESAPATGIQERGPGAWCIRRWLRLGSRGQDPREGWLHGVGGAAPRDLLRRGHQVREGGRRRHGRAGGHRRP